MLTLSPDISLPFVAERYKKLYSDDFAIPTKDFIPVEIRYCSETDYKKYIELFTTENFAFYTLDESNSRSILAFVSTELFSETNGTMFPSREKYSVINDPLIMGIINVTPDSFSDGGKYHSLDEAVETALEMLEEGADIIDVGGESTRPGALEVTGAEELERVVPFVEKLIRAAPEAVISVDTTKSQVAEETIKMGASIINDISGLTFDPLMADIIGKYSASAVIMHIKGTPRTMQENPDYFDVVREITGFLYLQAQKAGKANIDTIYLDPGFGFGKRLEDNYELILRFSELMDLGYPLLAGISRKMFLGKPYGLDVSERLVNTKIAEAELVKKGAKIIRTHDVKTLKNGIKLLKYIDNPFSR